MSSFLTFHEDEVCVQVDSLERMLKRKNDKFPGMVGISSILLKDLAGEISYPLGTRNLSYSKRDTDLQKASAIRVIRRLQKIFPLRSSSYVVSKVRRIEHFW